LSFWFLFLKLLQALISTILLLTGLEEIPPGYTPVFCPFNAQCGALIAIQYTEFKLLISGFNQEKKILDKFDKWSD